MLIRIAWPVSLLHSKRVHPYIAMYGIEGGGHAET